MSATMSATRSFYFGILPSMKSYIDVGDRHIEYEIRRYKRSRCIRISVRPHGVLVTAPKWVTKKEIERFALSRSEWIARHSDSACSVERSPEAKEHLRAMTRERVWEMLERVNALYRHNFERVFIRDVTSRWGSCSTSGNLNFSLRSGLLPERLLEYLVAHELCHLREMNHSDRFWALVERTIPDYRERRRELKNWKEE